MVKFLNSDGYCMLNSKTCDQQSCEHCDDYLDYRSMEDKKIKTLFETIVGCNFERINVSQTYDQFGNINVTMSKNDFEKALNNASDIGWQACEQYYLDIEMNKIKEKEETNLEEDPCDNCPHNDNGPACMGCIH